MNIPTIPSLDDLVKLGLVTLGFPAWAIAIFVMAHTIKGWLDSLRSISRTVSDGMHGLGHAVNAVKEVPSGARIVAVVITVMVWIVQGLLIGFMYLVGNYVSMAATDRPRGNRLIEAVRDGGAGSLPSAIWDSLKLDPISGGVVAVTVICIVASYQQAVRHKDPSAAGAVLALPAIVIGWMGLWAAGFFAVLALIAVAISAMNGDWSQTSKLLPAALPMIGGLAACGLYYGAAVAGTSASGLFVSTWQPRAGGSSSERGLLLWRR